MGTRDRLPPAFVEGESVIRRSTLRLYAPFIALAMLQAAFVAWAPSKGEQPTNAFANPVGGQSAFTPGAAAGGTAPVFGDAATSDGSSVGGSVAGGPARPRARGAAVTGDTSHCRGDRQTDIIYDSPPCVPKFVGDNGGATYPGVTRNQIKFIMMQCQSNEQVDAILSTQGLAATDEETDAMIAAAVKFINRRFEMYKRTLVVERIRMDCPTSPPDPARYRQAAAEIVKKRPAFVYVAGGGVWAADVFAQNGIVTLGVQWNLREFYTGRRPFRWEIFPTATETAEWMIEYYCKKMAGNPASNAGRVIHPTIGDRETKRKLGIVVPDDGSGTILPAAQQVSRSVERCSGVETPVFTYQSDIDRATEQTRVTIAGLIDEGVTTVSCMCDPIAPVFLTQGATQNNYYPEHWMGGLNFIDYDLVGRLYDPPQWNHAFGISQLAEQVPLEQTDAGKMWRDSGNEGTPCQNCLLVTAYLTLAGWMIHQAGPNLDPGTVEQGLVGTRYTRGGWEASGGDPRIYLIQFGPGDYNAISDFREVYWDASAPSTIDGKAGSYVQVNGGQRHVGGRLDRSFDIPAKPN